MGSSKKLIAIAFSDLHLNIWAKFNDHHQRTLEGFKVLDKIAGICSKKQVPALFCGDWLHKPESLDSDLAHYMKDWVYRTTKKYPDFKIFGIDGNHDLNKVNSFYNLQKGWLSFFQSTKYQKSPIVVLGPNTPFACLGEDIFVLGIPYIDHNKDLGKMLKNVRFIEGAKHILLLHTDYPGAKDTDGRVVDSSENINMNMLNQFDLVLCGHIHKPQRLGKKIYMVGAPNHQRRTDRNCDMGYWEVYSDMSVKFVPLKDFPRFIDVESEDQVKDDGNYYTVIPPKVEVKAVTHHNITKKLSKKRLAKKYLKYKGIKDENKEKLLVKILKDSESC
ncbi:MAG: metallophosphoesterase [Roseburia sp.]|nr:metallophosphoesterase [Roseburia sp.]